MANSIHTRQTNGDNVTPLHYLTQSFKKPFPKIHLKTVSTKETNNIIKSLKPKNSAGYDGILTRLLKTCSPYIASTLTYIYVINL